MQQINKKYLVILELTKRKFKGLNDSLMLVHTNLNYKIFGNHAEIKLIYFLFVKQIN